MGETGASWSKARILALGLEDVALGVAAHTKCIYLQYGHLLDRLPTATAVLPNWLGSFIFWIIQERDRGSRLV